MDFFIHGFLVGFAIAAPFGPIGALCLRRGLMEGWKYALASGLGAALADGVYGSIGAFGLTAVSDTLSGFSSLLSFFGGLMLIRMGVKSFTSSFADSKREASGGLLRATAVTFVLCLTSPVTIGLFIAAFAGLGFVAESRDYATGATLASGVFLGSLAMWIILSPVIHVLGTRMTSRHLRWIGYTSGTILTTFGFIAVQRVVL